MLRSIRRVRFTASLLCIVTQSLTLALLGGCTPDGGFERAARMQLAASPVDEAPKTFRAQMMPSLTSSRAPDTALGPCRPPISLCPATIKTLEQGAFLDFRANSQGERSAPRLLSPFAVVSIEVLDRRRCPAKLCAAHVALEGTLSDLLKDGYHTQSIALFPGSAVMTLRTERIGKDTKVLKGSCRFNLDPKCTDSNAWLQEDQKTGDKCGFSQTRVFVAASAAPDFVALAAFTPVIGTPAEGKDALRLAG